MSLFQDFGIILEGLGNTSVFIPETGYVRQGAKVWFSFGKQQLQESVGGDERITQILEGSMLVESMEDLELIDRVVEGKTVKAVKDGVWMVEGPYQRSDVKNANGRTYALKIWERLIADKNSPVQQNVKARGMVGHIEHPENGRTHGALGALITTELALKPDGVVWGASELLDTPHGFILQEYTKKNIRWGVSSRGNGSVGDDGKVNENDYMLEAFDAVMKPSVQGAFPTVSSAKEDDTSSSQSASLSESAGEVVEYVGSLREMDLTGTDADSHLQMAQNLVNGLSQVSSLAGEDALTKRQADDLQNWLMKKLKEVHETLAEFRIDAVVSEAVIESQEETDAADEPFRRVVQSYQTRLNTSVSENESLRLKLSATETRVKVAEAKIQQFAENSGSMEEIENLRAELEASVEGQSELEDRAVEAEEQLEIVQRELTDTASQLEIANDLLVQSSAVDVGDPVGDSVDEAISDQPDLGQFREVLENASSPEHVDVLVEQLIPAITAIAEPTPNKIERHGFLPPSTSPMVSESDAGKRTLATSTSQGARMAGRAVAHQQGKN